MFSSIIATISWITNLATSCFYGAIYETKKKMEHSAISLKKDLIQDFDSFLFENYIFFLKNGWHWGDFPF